MKKKILPHTILALLSFYLFVPLAPAQNNVDPKATLQRLRQEFSLTPEQCKKLEPILESHAQQLRSVQNDPSLTSLQKTLQEGDIRRAFGAKVDAILTPDQQAKLHNMKPPPASEYKK